MNEAPPDAVKSAPFDTARLDALLEDEGIDVLVATSKHNVQYLLGGYRFFFFDYMDAIGVSRYLPVVVYHKGRPDDSAYIGYTLERYEKQLGKFWPRVVETTAGNGTDAIQRAVKHIKGLAGRIGKVGVEASFLPWDGAKLLQDGLGNCQIVDAYFPLERLRVRKTRTELTQLREASERVVASMLAVFDGCAPGQTKNELVDRLRQEEVERGLTFEYCLITGGTSVNRVPSDQRLEAGDILSLDSGGNYKGYIGDLCRMGILGEPDAELVDLLGVIEEIQQQARRPIRRGATGAEIFMAAHEFVDASPHRAYLDFAAHGMGLVSHEAPRLMSNGPVPYEHLQPAARVQFSSAFRKDCLTRAMTRPGRWRPAWSSPSKPRWCILSAASSSSRIRSRSPKRGARGSAIRGGAGTGRDNEDSARSNLFQINLGAIAVAMPLSRFVARSRP